MKEFSKWTIEEVEDYFHLTPLETNEWLTAWLESEHGVITQDEETQLLELCQMLRQHVHDWNEEELKIYFIGALMRMVKYLQKDYQAFFERRISVTIDGESLSGIVDCLIAKGRRSPKYPFFCLHEYKPEEHSSNDPLGQITVAMVASRYLNNDEKPVYGAYIVGRLWYFLVLHGDSYAVSLAYDATKEDELRQILGRLKYIKQMIERELARELQE